MGLHLLYGGGGGGGTSSGTPLTRTTVKTANYTAALWDLVPCDTSGAGFTVTIPAASGGKGRIAVKLVTAGNTLSLALTGSDHFNSSTGATTGSLTLTNQGMILESDGVSVWTITADDIPLSQLDATYAKRSNNLSDIASASTARTNLGLGTAAVVNTGTGATNAILGNDSRLTDSRTPAAHATTHAPGGTDDLTTALSASSVPVALGTAAAGTGTGFSRQGHVHPTTGLALTANNLSDLASAATARTNLAAAPLNVSVTTQSGTTYTLALADASTAVHLSNASAITLTVPPNSSVAFPVGTQIIARQYGAGQVTFAPGAGVTLRSRGAALKTAAQYSGVTLHQVTTDEWVLEGDLTT